MNAPVLALSRRRTARILGIRPETVATLVHLGKLTEVPWGNRRRIPLVDVERLAREGWTLEEKAPRKRTVSRPAADVATAIRAIDLESLTRRS